ncbi:MAG: WG repeat-containing protein [Alistipes sp.]|nr:WG repeat-containing protein [Alistipes sp.]
MCSNNFKAVVMTIVFATASFASASAQSETFKWARNVKQQTVRDYSDGFSAYYENGFWGFITTGGEVAISPSFDEVGDFINSLCLVKQDGKWGVINKNGSFVHNCEYDNISKFSDGVAIAEINGVKHYLYSDGRKKQLSMTYEFNEYSDGFTRIKDRKKGKWGYADLKGVFRINPSYDSATDFNNGLAIVTKDGKAYQINKAGDRKSLPFVPNESLVVFDNGTGYIKNSNGNYQFFIKGFNLIAGEFTKIGNFSDGVIKVTDVSGGVHYLNERGEKVLTLKEFADGGDFSEGKAWVRKNSKYGYIDKTGKLVVDTLFTYASNFNNHLAYVARGQRQGVIKMKDSKDTFPLIDISNITLSDNSGNNIVEAEEQFSISFTVKNIGDEILNDATFTLGLNTEQMDWFKYDNTLTNIGTLNPGEERVVTFTGSSTTDVVSEVINLSIKGEGDNLFNPTTLPYEFTASGINACRPVLETFWVYTDDHSPLTPGQTATLKMTVMNTGTDKAKDVTVNLDWPEGIDYADKQITIPSIAPNETVDVTTTFTVSDGYADNLQKEFSMVAMVDEYTHKRNDVKYISFATGKRNALTNLVSGAVAMQSDYVQPVVKKMAQSELLVDLDQKVAHARNRYALVIGNEDYNSMKQGATYQPDVEFAVRDAETFAKFATNMMGVKEDNVILVKNATYAQLKSNLEKITKLAKANPDNLELIVYYAGHGQIDGDTKESYLIPVDVSLTSPTAGMKLEDFYATLSSCNASKTMVFLDACYSGVGRGIIIRPKDTPVKGNLLVMTATSSTQRSMPYQEKSHGLFTYFLLKTLKDNGNGISIGDLYEEVSATVKTKSILINNAEQTPELINGPDIASDWRNWIF